MKILVIGSGGREHALAWRLAQADKVQKDIHNLPYKSGGCATLIHPTGSFFIYSLANLRN
jgi:phosphoribosylamine-glycine ligase